jgi:hypothetical protein
MIVGHCGRLGAGKTLSTVIWGYEGWEQYETVFSNIWVDFDHIPIKTPYDFLGLYEGRFIADELWSMADNRRAMSALNKLTTILLLRSRKKKFSFCYTQQYFQIDPRVAFITDIWVKPEVIPYDPYHEIPPELLILHRWDGDLNPMQDLVFDNLEPFLEMYNTEKDPYTLQGLLNEKALKEAIRLALKDEDIIGELEDLTEKAKSSDILKKVAEIA